MTKKNPHAVALGRKGGQAKSDAKTAAAQANIKKRWANREAEADLGDKDKTPRKKKG